MRNQVLSSTSPTKLASGNYSGLPRSKAIVSHVKFESKRDERPWGKDVVAGLRAVRQDLAERERAKLPPDADTSKSLFGVVRAIFDFPLGSVLFTEGWLRKYRALCKNPSGIGADYTGGIIEKLVVPAANGVMVQKEPLVFTMVAANPWAGEFSSEP